MPSSEPASGQYAQSPPEHRSKALDELNADSKKFGGTYYESQTILAAFSPELDKAYIEGADITTQVKAAANIMNQELDKAWQKFKA